MPTISLQTFIRSVPTRSAYLQSASADPSFTDEAAFPAPYVWPDVRVPQDFAKSQVLLMTAPGAMGKSAAAHAIASSTKAPLIDLSKLPVGSDSLTGLLTRTLGWGQAATYISELVAGRSTIVLDAVDEAQLLAGREHFIAFLRNIKEVLASATASSGQFVILGRRDAIETSYLELMDLGVSAAISYIEPMSHSNAGKLIDVMLDQKTDKAGNKYTVHRLHPGPSSTLRTRLFKQIANAYLGEELGPGEIPWDRVRAFLGYPPVLMALAEWLAVDNPTAHDALLPGNQGQSLRGQRGAILQDVVENILDRESQKVRDQIAPMLSIASSDARMSSIYTREEQILRIVKYVALDTDPVQPPASLNPGERAVYEERLSGFVPDHPFLSGRAIANSVFADYLLAFTSTSPLSDLHGNPQREISARSAIGPFFCHFVHAMTPPPVAAPEGSRALHILTDETLVDSLMSSFRLGCTTQGYAQYLHSKSAFLFLTDFDEAQREVPVDFLGFHIKSPDGVLTLGSGLSNALIVTKHGVVITATGSDLSLGPNVTVICESLQLGGSRVSAIGPRPRDSCIFESAENADVAEVEDNFGVFLTASEVAHDPRVQVHSYPNDALRVSWPDPWFSWTPFLSKGDSNSVEVKLEPSVSWQLMFGLRRIITSFHSRAKANPSIVSERMEQFVIGQNPMFAATLKALIAKQVISVRSGTYELSLERLSQYGISWGALTGADFAEVLRHLHLEIAASEEIRSAVASS